MASNIHFSDPDIREALHNKYDSETAPCLTDDFMDKVIARTIEGRHSSTFRFRKAIKAAVSVAASIIIIGVAIITILNYRADESSSQSSSAIHPQNSDRAFAESETLSVPIRESQTLVEDKHLASAERSFSSAVKTVSPQKHSTGNKAIDKISSVPDSKPEPATKPSDNGNIEYYTQETQQMLAARFDRGKEQSGELRAIIENNQLNDINK